MSGAGTAKAASNAPMGEILAWAMYDVANATYATIIATAVYNAYFVQVVAGPKAGLPQGTGTLLLTVVICLSSLIIVVTAPVIGTICDAAATKKKMLLVSTALCVIATGALAFVGAGEFIPAMLLLCLANVAFGTGEDLIAAFLPELASKEDMGRISSIGWSAGYVGGLISLGTCCAFVAWAQGHGQTSTQFVPVILLISAAYFAVAVLPTFVWLRERAQPDPHAVGKNPFAVGFERLAATISHAKHYGDLFNFLIALFLYSCGTTTVVHLASVYAQEVIKFTAQDSIIMILVVNLTAALGAAAFGFVQDKIGSIRTLHITLSIWTAAILVAYFAQTKPQLWLAANLVGVAMGSTGSVGRALVGQFAPTGRSGEFLGLWGVAVKLATAVGALTFGAVAFMTHNNYRLAILSTTAFFFSGMVMLLKVNEDRGKAAANTAVDE